MASYGLWTGEYSTMYHDTESLAKGTWSPPQSDPGSSKTGARRYGAAHLLEVMFM